MQYKIKWRFLLKLSLLILVAATITHFAHRWQVRKQVGAFLYQADLARDEAAKAEAAGNSESMEAQRDREQNFLSRYIMARPGDFDARERLARLKTESAKTRRQRMAAYFLLEDVLRRDPSRTELRRFTAEYAMRIGLFKEAEGHIEMLLQAQPEDGELEGMFARCLVAEKDFAKAEEHYVLSIQHSPDLIDSYSTLAFLRRIELKKSKEADKVIEQMLAKNANNFRAHLIAAAYVTEFPPPEKPLAGQILLPTAEVSVARARELAPNDREVLLAAADIARIKGRSLARDVKTKAESDSAFAEARDLLNRVIKEYPKSTSGYLALASFESESQDLPKAIETIQTGLIELPDSDGLLLGLLEYQFRAGDSAGASETLAKLQERGLSPEMADFQRARVLVLQDKWDEALPLLERAVRDLETAPDIRGTSSGSREAREAREQRREREVREARILLGQCYGELGYPERRLDAFTRALNYPTPLLVSDPLWLRAKLGLAEAQAALGQARDTLDTYRTLSEWVPAANLQVARLELIAAMRNPEGKRDWSRVEDALARAEKADKRFIPNDTELRLLRATLTGLRGNSAEARKLLEQLRDERPKEIGVWLALAMQDAQARTEPGQKPASEVALETLAAGEKAAGDSPDLRLTRARIWVNSEAPELYGSAPQSGSGNRTVRYGQTTSTPSRPGRDCDIRWSRTISRLLLGRTCTPETLRLECPGDALRPSDPCKQCRGGG
jgi:cellulose synthase operon protein C